MTPACGYVEVHAGDSFILRSAMKMLRGRIARGDHVLTDQAILRFQRLIGDVESCEDHAAVTRKACADVWSLAI